MATGCEPKFQRWPNSLARRATNRPPSFRPLSSPPQTAMSRAVLTPLTQIFQLSGVVRGGLRFLRSAGLRRWTQVHRILFVHYYDTHGPFRATEDLIAEFRRDVPPRPVTVPSYQVHDGQNDMEFYSDLYDASIRQQDALFGRLLRSVDLDRTIVVVIADHGESFDERHIKIDHGAYVYEEQTHIQMLVHVPGRKARRVEAMVETTDLLPSLLEWLGIPSTGALDGVSFVEPAESGEGGTRVYAVSIADAQNKAFEDRGYKLDSRYPVASILTEEAPSGN